MRVGLVAVAVQMADRRTARAAAEHVNAFAPPPRALAEYG
jgi:hypothetical protein